MAALSKKIVLKLYITQPSRLIGLASPVAQGPSSGGVRKQPAKAKSATDDSPTDATKYNSTEYYSHGTFSYYDIDAQCQKHRIPQPSKFDPLKPKK